MLAQAHPGRRKGIVGSAVGVDTSFPAFLTEPKLSLGKERKVAEHSVNRGAVQHPGVGGLQSTAVARRREKEGNTRLGPTDDREGRRCAAGRWVKNTRKGGDRGKKGKKEFHVGGTPRGRPLPIRADRQ